ncbi:MAG: 3-deoxy-8-phosphooctulonate synthase [Verrucomicrobiota bacterium]|nr:3-deoxy-8-phosphooctulonate synthase [Verrucomicrobiota bacterium]
MRTAQEVSAGKIKIGGEQPLALIAGPCVIESEQHSLMLAERLCEIAARLSVPFIYKASFDKANRTSVESYRGPGITEGLRILALVKSTFDVPVLTDVHEVWQVEPVAQVVDVLQIPAFLCRQTDLLLAAGRSGRPVNLKKGQFLSPWEMSRVVEKIESTGNRKIIVTERGTCFGYQNLVVDMRSFSVLRRTGYPVVFDVTHSLQLPGAGEKASGGMLEFIEPLARAGVAAGVDGVFMEVHDNPPMALSDAATSLALERIEDLLSDLKAIHSVLRNRRK